MSKVEIDLDLLTNSMNELKKEKARLDFDLKEVKAEMEKIELQLVALLSQHGLNQMNYKCYSFGIKELKENFADIAEKCTFTKKSEKFEFKVGVV